MTSEEIRKLLHQGIVSFKSGWMGRRITLREDLLPARKKASYYYGRTAQYVRDPSLIKAWDVDKEGWRSFHTYEMSDIKLDESTVVPKLNKYSVGDEVWVKGNIVKVDSFNQITVAFEGKSVSTHYYEPKLFIHQADVKKHIPAPKPILVGSKVKQNAKGSSVATVIAIADKRAWVQWDSSGIFDTVWLADLTVI